MEKVSMKNKKPGAAFAAAVGLFAASHLIGPTVRLATSRHQQIIGKD